MYLLDDKVRDRQQRYLRLATLLGEEDTTGRLGALALEMEKHREKFGQASAGAEEGRLVMAILLAEIDVFLARARGAMFFASRQLRPLRFSAYDLWEAAQLCREEAEASVQVALRRALASRALELVMLGEKIAREETGGRYEAR
jgi:hypothetical protein